MLKDENSWTCHDKYGSSKPTNVESALLFEGLFSGEHGRLYVTMGKRYLSEALDYIR